MSADERSSRLALALLFLNILLILFGMFASAWQPASRAVHTAAPYNLVDGRLATPAAPPSL